MNELNSAETSPASPPPSPLRSEAAFDPVRNYFRQLRWIFTRPADFFRAMPKDAGLAGPLTFALVTHWGCTSLQRMVQLFISGVGIQQDFIAEILKAAGVPASALSPSKLERFRDWFDGVGGWILDPFTTLITILWSAIFVHIFASLLIPTAPDRRVSTYEIAVRVLCYAVPAQLLALVPGFGPLLAWGYAIALTTIGLRETYRVTTSRALLVIAAPKLILIGLFLGVLGLILGVALSFFL